MNTSLLRKVAKRSKWLLIESAPQNGSCFFGKKNGRKLVTWFGKTSHIPLWGWCHGTDPENIDLWQPTHWAPYKDGGVR